MKRYAAAVGWALGMLVLILDGKTALSGAAEGVELCLRTLIPSLFPFFLLSAMMTSSLSGGALLLTGILGGYPVGAANAAQAFRAGRISREEAERLVVLCNCAGPSFLFGVVGPLFEEPGAGFCLWGVYLLSVLMLWLLLPKRRHASAPCRPLTLRQAFSNSIRAMAAVCGWVVLFRVVLAILDRWALWLLPDWGRVTVYGFLELSNGCLALGGMEPGLRFILAAGMVSFGGLCVLLQTAGVAEGISLRLYFPGKVFQCAVCLLLASFLCPGSLAPAVQGVFCLIALVSGWILRKSKKRCGNRCLVGV